MRSPLRAAAAAAVLVSLLPLAALAENRTTVHIVTVLASMEGRTFDSRLAAYKNELRPLRFRSYNQVNTETRVLHGSGGQYGMELPGGRYLHITTEEHTPDHVRLHILLNEDNHPVVNTSVKLELGSVVMLGGPRDQSGTLVIRIGSRPWRNEDGEGGEEQVLPQRGEPPAAKSGTLQLHSGPDSGSRLVPVSPPAPAGSPAVPVAMPGEAAKPDR